MTNHLVSLNERIVQADGNLVSEMNGEKVMLSIHSGKYYNLGQVGGRIWELVAAPITVNKLMDMLTLEYDIEPERCEQQVISFINSLMKENIIQVREEVK